MMRFGAFLLASGWVLTAVAHAQGYTPVRPVKTLSGWQCMSIASVYGADGTKCSSGARLRRPRSRRATGRHWGWCDYSSVSDTTSEWPCRDAMAERKEGVDPGRRVGSLAQSQKSNCSLSSYVAVEWALRLHNLWLAWMLGCP